ncbi:excalibur calcium-binding domain-containing protein [Rhodococcus sp. NPDC058521]|uniref:excalibur calcium-binding domain-containing protein n=1 Tax=Rhodococcus sp. NPDC058521 TaxID=3346536 RepID=UPI00365DC48A
MRTRRYVFGIIGCAALTVGVAPAAQASTIFDFLPPEIASMIPSGSADAVNPLLPPAPAPPTPPAPAPAPPQITPAPPQQSAPPAPRGGAMYKNCTEARNAGVTPIYRGEEGYASHLDRDNDGIACE